MTEAYAAAGRLGLSAAGACGADEVSAEAGLVDRLIDLLMALEPFEIKQSVIPSEQAEAPAPGEGPGHDAGEGAGEGAGEAAGGAAAGAGAVPESLAATSRMGTQSGAGTGAASDAAAGSAEIFTAGSDVSAGMIEVPGMARDAAGASDVTPSPGDEAAKLSVESTRAMLARMRAVLDREAARLGEDGLEGKAAVDQVALIARTLEKIDQMERLIAQDQARAAAERLGPRGARTASPDRAPTDPRRRRAAGGRAGRRAGGCR